MPTQPCLLLSWSEDPKADLTSLCEKYKDFHGYRNDPKFSDRQVWANSADPDQTAPRGAV